MATIHAFDPKGETKPKSRVLVVDDDLDTVQSMAMLIKAFGHEVDFAINGFAAIEAARKFRPDVILLDINLPGVKGDKLAAQLRFEPGLEHARIIAVTGQADEAVKQLASAAGIHEFHVKPLAPTVLEEILNRA